MAQKRMFDKDLINTDKFSDMPLSTKGLYFLLGLEADDLGFVSPRRVMRVHGGSEDDLKILIAKEFLIYFETGVVVIADWNKNNWLDKRRIKETEYQEELSRLIIHKGKYFDSIKCSLSNGLATAPHPLGEKRREENRTEENRREQKRKNNKRKIIDCYFENSDVNNLFLEFLDFRKKLKAKNTERAIKLLVTKLNEYDDKTKIEMLNTSIMNSWKSVYQPKNSEKINNMKLPDWSDI